MLYLVSFFISPLGLLLAGKPFQAILNAIIYVLAIILVVTVFFGLVGVGLWAIGVAHAVFVIHGKRTDQRTERMIAAMKAGKPS